MEISKPHLPVDRSSVGYPDCEMGLEKGLTLVARALFFPRGIDVNTASGCPRFSALPQPPPAPDLNQGALPGPGQSGQFVSLSRKSIRKAHQAYLAR
ncbi:hypothetical protein V2G26_000287 [Clonostachys chloroleuca]